MSSDERRIEYLAGEEDGSLSAHERAGLDELRATLASGAVWAQPPPALEDSIVAAIATEAPARGPARAGGPSRR